MKHVTKHQLKDLPATYTWYGIHEVFYHENKVGYTANPIDLTADSVEDLESAYRMIGEAFKKPILDYKENDNG
jgi:hypothetical protein